MTVINIVGRAGERFMGCLLALRMNPFFTIATLFDAGIDKGQLTTTGSLAIVMVHCNGACGCQWPKVLWRTDVFQNR